MWVGGASIPLNSMEKQKRGGPRPPGPVLWPAGHHLDTRAGGLNLPLPRAGVWRARLRKMKKINKSRREK